MLPFIVRPTYPLAAIKRSIRANRCWLTDLARDEMGELDFEESDVVRCVLAMSERHCRKTEPSEAEPDLWQDVYRTRFEGTVYYVKVQLDRVEQAVVIDFKRAG